ncbi:unnamed protein product, partial [Symbiodinium sp. KB8]
LSLNHRAKQGQLLRRGHQEQDPASSIRGYAAQYQRRSHQEQGRGHQEQGRGHQEGGRGHEEQGRGHQGGHEEQ